jgi:hypothetical protein
LPTAALKVARSNCDCTWNCKRVQAERPQHKHAAALCNILANMGDTITDLYGFNIKVTELQKASPVEVG